MHEHRCAACGAAVTADASWCTLCFTPVAQSAADPVPIGASSPRAPGGTYAGIPDALAQTTPDASLKITREAYPADWATQLAVRAPRDFAPPGRERAAASGADLCEATWPCLSCETANAFGVSSCANCGLSFLAAARTPPQFVVPVIGDVLALPRPQQIAFISVCGAVFVALVLGVMALLGLFV